MKRALSLIIVLAMVFVMVPFSAFAETQELPEYGLADDMATGAYSYTWTAPNAGTAEFTLGTCDGYEVMITDKNEMEVNIQGDVENGYSATVENVAEGDTFTINVVVTADPTAYVYISVYCAAPAGTSQDNPIAYESLPTETPIIAGWSEETVWLAFYFLDANDQPYESVTVTGPARVTYLEQTFEADPEIGSVTIPLQLDMSSGRPRAFATMGFTNMGRAAMPFQLTFNGGEGGDVETGTMDNPAALEPMLMGEVYGFGTEFELTENNAEGYWLQWTNDLDVSGIIALDTVSIYDPDTYMPVSAQVEVEVINPDTYVSSGNSLYDSMDDLEIVNKPLTTVRVYPGHIVKIHVIADGAYNESGAWTSPKAGVNISGMFLTDEDENIYLTNEGKGFKAPVAAGDTVSYLSGDMGGKTVIITSPSEEAMAAASVLAMSKPANDWEAEFAPVGEPITANEEGKIVFTAPLGHEVKIAITNNYEYNTNFVIAQQAPIGFEANPEIVEAGEVSVTTADGADVVYWLSYTATESGTLTVTPISATLVSDPSVDMTASVAIDLYDANGEWIASNDIWSGIATAEYAVEAGDEIKIWVYARDMMWNVVGLNVTLEIKIDAGEELPEEPVDTATVRFEDGTLVSCATVEEALSVAEAGSTVELIADCEADILVIKPGVTLDLGCYDLTANGLVGLTGSYLVGTRYSTGADCGKLIVPQDKLVMTGGEGKANGEKNVIMPIWNGEDAYVLTQGYIIDEGGNYGLVVNEETKTIEFRFGHSIGGSVNRDLLNNGASDNAMKIIIRLSWENEQGVAYQDFVYNDEFVAKVAGGGYNYTFSLTGYDALNIDINNLTVTAMFVTDCGIVVPGRTF